VYVDNLLIVGEDKKEVKNVKIYLSQAFNKIKDLKNVEKYLGLRMTRSNKHQLILQQTDYIESILNEYKNKNINIKIRNTPLPHELKSLVENDVGEQDSILD
jgi:ribosome-interacting GTPase 1